MGRIKKTKPRTNGFFRLFIYFRVDFLSGGSRDIVFRDTLNIRFGDAPGLEDFDVLFGDDASRPEKYPAVSGGDITVQYHVRTQIFEIDDSQCIRLVSDSVRPGRISDEKNSSVFSPSAQHPAHPA